MNIRYPLVTGAGGSIAKYYVRRLSKKTKVYALVRSEKDLRKFHDLKNVIVVKADLNNTKSLQKILKNVNIIYHLASSITNDWKVAFKNNVNGTKSLVIASNRSGIKHIHLISSIAVYGLQKNSLVTENSPHNAKDPYGITKSMQEKIIFDKKNKFTASAVRPANVIGPEIYLWTHFILSFLMGKRGFTPPLFFLTQIAARYPFPYVEVENLIDLSIKITENKKTYGQIFNAIDENSTWEKILNSYAKVVLDKKTYKPISITYPLQDILSLILKNVGNVRSSDFLIKLSKNFSRNPQTYSNLKARKLLGYKTRVTLSESIQKTRLFVKKSGIIQRS